MKVEDLHTLKIEVPELDPTSKSGDVRLTSPDRNEVMMGMIDYQAYPEFDFYPGMPSKGDALRAAALFRAAYQLQEALKDLLTQIGESYTMRREIEAARAALALSENTAETVTP